MLAYAVVADAERALAGLGADVRAVGDGPWLVLGQGDAVPRADASALRAHHALVAGIAARTACLPCRFGQVVADDGAALRWLAPRRERAREALERVRDADEFSLRLSRPAVAAPDPATAGPGTRYLAALRERHAAFDEPLLARLAEAVAERFGALVAERVADASGLAVLVRRADRDAFAAAARGWRVALPAGVNARWSGPWPAYAFAARSLEEAA